MIPILKIGTSVFAVKDIKEATKAVEILSKALSVEMDFNKGSSEYEYIPQECNYRGTVELTFIQPHQLKIEKNLTPKSRRLTSGGSQ